MNKRQLKLTDYEGFEEKFKPKKTTDDCYTPAPVYDAVVAYVDKYVNPLAGREIVRPFWPGGDYERHEYPTGCIVIDNPPFSITSQILRFYKLNKIDFFLFCNGLTMFNAETCGDLTYHIVNKGIIFENGANVNVGFVTNIRKDGEKVVLAGILDTMLREANKQPDKSKAIVEYPKEVISSALLKKYISNGLNISIPSEAVHSLASQDQPFGGGFMAATSIIEELERERERERLTERRPMSPAFHEQLKRLNERFNGELHILSE